MHIPIPACDILAVLALRDSQGTIVGWVVSLITKITGIF